MPLPALLAAQATVARPAGRRRAVSPVAGKAAALGLVMEHQEQTLWCWSAVAVSVRRFYFPTNATTQCQQANVQLGMTACCDNPAPCNKPSRLDPNVFAFAGGPFSFDDVKQQIDNRRIVAAHITWNDGTSHFACIDGYNAAGATPLLSIQDPWYGPSIVPYDAFHSNYQGIGGRWDESHRS